jgi:O-acetylserine/cysteine efflux transporter
MKPLDILLAIAVAVIWGLAFVASRIALDQWSKRPQASPKIA